MTKRVMILSFRWVMKATMTARYFLISNGAGGKDISVQESTRGDKKA